MEKAVRGAAYMRLDHELLHASHEVVDFRQHQPPCDDRLEEAEGRHGVGSRLHVCKRPRQHVAQLRLSRLQRTVETVDIA